MALTQGGVTARRYAVPVALPDGLEDTLVERIQRFAFRELTPEDEDRPVAGWAAIDNPLDTEFELARCVMEDYVALAYRVEKRSVQSILLKGYLSREEQRVCEETGVEVLSRDRQRELRANVTARLLQETTPRIAVYEVVWNRRTGLLVVGTTSSNMVAEIRSYFEKTFELTVTPLFPFQLGLQLGVSAGRGERLEGIDQAFFAPDVAKKVLAMEGKS